MDLVEFLKLKIKLYGEKPFLLGEGTYISYREFGETTDRIAYGLEKIGIKPKDHVGVLHSNSSQVLLTYFSIIKAGGVVVPINTIYTPREIKFILNNSNAKALILHEAFLPQIEKIRDEIPQVRHIIVRKNHETVEMAVEQMVGSPVTEIKEKHFEPDDVAIIFYTSGTTGNPKGVVLTHRNFCFSGPNIAQNYCLRETDITIAALPMVHVFCIASAIFGSLSSGGSIVVLDRFKNELVLEAIEKYKVTWFPGVPTMFIYLLNGLKEKRYNIASLRMGLSGGASLPVEVLKEWEEKFNAKVIEVYGLTESTGLVTANPFYGIRKPGSIGITVSGVEAKVVDNTGKDLPHKEVGHLIFKGQNATKTYYNLPEETSERIKGGWIYTGDHAWQDEEGYFYIVGREKELIISGGYNIYPREIEEVLYGYSGVDEVAVIGVPDPMKGEVPKAFVTVKEGFDITEKALLDYCGENLAPYKIPKIEFMDELPKMATGKIAKKGLH